MKKQTYLKSIYRLTLVALCLMTMGVGEMWGRVYSNEEILYVKNIKPSSLGGSTCWKVDGGYVWAVFDGASETNCEATKVLSSEGEGAENTLYAIQVPNGTHTTVTLYRGSAVGTQYEGDANKTGAIPLDATKNYLDGGYDGSNATTATWSTKAMHPKDRVLYLQPNSDWKSDARFAAYFFDGKHIKWVDATVHSGDYYKVTVPDRNWPYVIFCRMKGSDPTNAHTNPPCWNKTGDLAPDGTNNFVEITGWDNSQDWKRYAATTVLASDMNDWSPDANPFSGSPLKLTMELPAHKAYQFKIVNGFTWYGYGTNDNELAYAGDSKGAKLSSSNSKNIMLYTGGGGTFTFEWDASKDSLFVTSPAPKHPSMDYVYIEKYADWGDGTYVYVHQFYNDGGDGENMTNWFMGNPKLTTYHYFYDKAKNYYTIPLVDSHPNMIVKNQIGNSSGNHETLPMYSADHHGHYIVHNGTTWVWDTLKVHVKLENMEATSAGTTSRDVQFNGKKMTKIDCPTKTNYDFGGYYTEMEGAGEQIIDTNGKWKVVADYLSADSAWIHAGDTTKLYAKWTEKSFTVTLNAGDHGTVNSGSGEVSTSTTVTGHPITSSSTFTVTAADGYAFERWTLEPSGVAVITETASSGATKTFTITTSAAVTITPNYYARYGLYGSLDDKDNTKAGMPGWPSDPATGSTYSEGTYTFSLSLTKPNAIYKFRILDRRDNTSWGLTSKTIVSEKTNTVFNSTSADAQLATAGKGTYTITVTEDVDGESVTHPKVYIENPTSYLVTLGHKSVILEGDEGTLGTIIAKDAANNEYTSGQYIASGETVTIVTTCPDDYQLAGLWNSSAYSGDPLGFSSWVVGEAVKAYAKFTEKSKTFSASSDNNWNSTGNWSGGAVPTANEVAILQAPVNVDIAHAVAKRVIIDQNSKTGKLTIQANKGLEVTGTITKTTNGSSYTAPTAADLVLESSSAGNASLIFNNSNTAQATVQMYSKANIDNGTWNWQFMGIPFTTTKANPSYYGSYLYEWNNSGAWDELANGATMTAFKGYCITQDAATTYVMSGTLNPTTSHAWTIPAGKEFVMANSWTAPIYVGAITDEALAVETKTIYLFNTGHNETGIDTEGEEAGTYRALPIHAAKYTGDSLIAPMQGFYVDNTGGSAGTVTLDYATVVRPTGTRNDIIAGPMHAPKRTQEQQEDDRPTVLKMWANGTLYNDRVVLLEREGFSTGFDNGWDGKKLSFGEVGPSVYVINQIGEPEAVSAIPDLEGTVIGFRAGTNNTCTMTFEYDGEDVFYLNDLQAQQSARIDNERSYTFATDANDDEARFIISATPIAKTPTGIDPVTDNRSPLTVTKILLNGNIYIIREGHMFGIDGLLVK